MYALGTYSVIGRSTQQVGSADLASREALGAANDLPKDDGGGRTTSTSQPPLYYALGVLPYLVAEPIGATAQVRAVRLLSAVLFALSAMLAAVLVGVLFPSTPWAPAVGGMWVALAPVPGFIAGGVNPDSLLVLCSVALTLAVVLGLRTPTPGRAALIGLVAGLGMISKLTFAGLLPAAGLAVLALSWRGYRQAGRGRAVQAVGAAAAAALGPLALYLVWVVLQGRALLPPGSSTPALPNEVIPPYNLREHLSYAWQLFLPRIPGQDNHFGFSPITGIWINGWLGRYGWLDYGAPSWMIRFGTWGVWILLGLAASGLLQRRRAVKRHLAEVACFVVMVVGLGAVIALIGYDYKRTTGFVFEQARYLFPLLGIGACMVVAATFGLGRRLGPAVAIVLTAVFALHALSGLVLTVSRYYAS